MVALIGWLLYTLMRAKRRATPPTFRRDLSRLCIFIFQIYVNIQVTQLFKSSTSARSLAAMRTHWQCSRSAIHAVHLVLMGDMELRRESKSTVSAGYCNTHKRLLVQNFVISKPSVLRPLILLYGWPLLRKLHTLPRNMTSKADWMVEWSKWHYSNTAAMATVRIYSNSYAT